MPKAAPLHMSAAQYREYVKSGLLPQAVHKQHLCAAPELEARRTVPGSVKDERGMNKTEAAYAVLLDQRKQAGQVADWKFEAITLRLAPRTTYTPDFYVEYPDGHREFHETKGFMREDANVKLKVAASMFSSFTFRLVKRKAGAWAITEVAR